MANLERRYGPLPDTICVHTGGGGWHFYFLWNDDCAIPSKAGDIAPGVDTRGVGGLVAAPTSLHKSGNYYEVAEGAVSPAACPETWLRALVAERAPVKQGVPTAAGAVIPEGTRRQRILQLAGAMSRQGMTADAMVAAIGIEVEKTFENPDTVDDIRAIVEDILRKDRERQAAQDGADVREDTSAQGAPPPPASGEWPEFEELGEEIPPVPAFDLELLPESLRAIVKDTAERIGCVIDFIACATITALAGVTNRRAAIQPKALDTGWKEWGNIWSFVVGSPGTMKTPGTSEVLRIVRDIEKEWMAEDEGKTQQYERDQAIDKMKYEAWYENSKKKCKEDDKNKPDPPPTPKAVKPQVRRLLTSDPTQEKMHEMLVINPAGVTLWRDEISGWVANLDRPGRESERAFFWSAGRATAITPATASVAEALSLIAYVSRCSAPFSRHFCPAFLVRSLPTG